MIPKRGIYLFVAFDWPQPFNKADAAKAKKLHAVVKGQTWIREAVAASGGIGQGPQSIWIFWLENYAALDRLLHNKEDVVCQAYIDFFAAMPLVQEQIKEEVLFLEDSESATE